MMKKLNNQIMLITYADSMGKNLKELHTVLNRYYHNAIGGVHILPFFPSSADRGFAPVTYEKVDEAFGTFDDVEALGEDYYLMFDFMVNHISAHSEYFQDFLYSTRTSRRTGTSLSAIPPFGKTASPHRSSWI